MADYTTLQRLGVDLLPTTTNTNIHLDVGTGASGTRRGIQFTEGGSITNDHNATSLDNDRTGRDYQKEILVAEGFASIIGSAAEGTVAGVLTEKVDFNDTVIVLQSFGGTTDNDGDSGGSRNLTGTIRLTNVDIVFAGSAQTDWSGHSNVVGGAADAASDAIAVFVPIYDGVRFINQLSSGSPRISFRGANPRFASLNNVFFDVGCQVFVNGGIIQNGASFGSEATGVVFIMTTSASGNSITNTLWTPWPNLDTSEISAGNIRIDGGNYFWMINPLLNGTTINSATANNNQPSRTDLLTAWQPNFVRSDTRTSVTTDILFDNALTIYRAPDTFNGRNRPTATTTTGVISSIENQQLYLIQEGFRQNTTTVTAVTYSGADREFRHYAYELNLDNQNLSIGTFTGVNRSGNEVTRFGSNITGFDDNNVMVAEDTTYELPVDLLADASTLADAIATTFVVDNTDKLYQGIKARYVTDQTDVDWSEIANTPTGSSIDLGDDDITWVDGTTESIAIDGTSHSVTVTTDEIGTLSNGAFTSEIITTGTVALTGTALTNVDIDAGNITGYGDLVNSNLTSDSAIALSSSISYGGATLTSTLSNAINFTSVPVDLSDVTLNGSNTEDTGIANVAGDAISTFTDVTWEGVVDFDDTDANIVHVFVRTTFDSLPTNTEGGGVDFRLGAEDTLMSTFGQATAPTGFTFIRDDKDIVITIPNSVTQPVFYKIYINGVAQADPSSSLSSGANTITIDEGDIGNNTIEITFTGADIIEETISGAYADNIDTTLTLNPFFSQSTATSFSTSLTGNVFRILVPSNEQSIGSAGVHNASAFTAKSTQNYANYMALANQSDVDGRITSTASNNVIYYTDGTFETKLMVTDGGSVSDVNLGGAFWRTSFGGTPFSFAAGDDDGNGEDFNEAIVDGLTIFTTPTSGAAATTEANVVFTSVSEDTTDYSTLRVVVDASIAAANGLTAEDFFNTLSVKAGPVIIPQRPTN